MIKRKINNQYGFSLAETLLAVLILLLVSVIVATGVPAATNAYEKVVIGANAKVLLSTTISALRDELATAKNVTVDNSTMTITYYSADIGATSKIYLSDGTSFREDVIMVQEYVDVNPSNFGTSAPAMHNVTGRPLIPSKAGTNGLYVTYDGVSYNPGDDKITITGVEVKRDSSSTSYASADLTIRFLIPKS